jgi:hypothetical protein
LPSGFDSDNDDALECCSRACASLAAKVIRVAEGTDDAIDSMADYAAIAAKNAFKDYLRERTPARQRFANRVQRVLLEDPQFGIWVASGTEQAGYAGWEAQHQPRVSVSDLRSRDAELRRDVLLGSDWDKGDETGWNFVQALLTRLFDLAGGPIELDSMIGYLVDLVGIPSTVLVAAEGPDPDEPVEIAQPDPRARSPEALLIARDRAVAELGRFWACCQKLPRESLLALMLNLPGAAESSDSTRKADAHDERDARPENTPRKREKKSGSRGEIGILAVRGVASIAEIGRTLNLTGSECDRLWTALRLVFRAESTSVEPIYHLWRHLPLKDEVIAAVLERKADQIPKIRERASAKVRRCMTDQRLIVSRHMAPRPPSVSVARPSQ